MGAIDMEPSLFPVHEDLFCTDLPTWPLSGDVKILVMGASGYIGGRLIHERLARGYQMRVMVRSDAFPYQNLWPEGEVVTADALTISAPG